MALWQFDLLLVPRRRLPRPTQQRVTVAELDSVHGWAGVRWNSAIDRLISSFTRPRQGWDVETKAWGDADGNRIDVLLEQDQIVEVTARIDARDVQERFVAGVVELALRLECVFVTAELQVVPPLAAEVSAALERSSARSFVRDPDAFLSSRDEGAAEW